GPACRRDGEENTPLTQSIKPSLSIHRPFSVAGLKRIGDRMGLRSFTFNRGGNVAVMFSLAMPMVLAAGAFGVETTSWFMKRSSMQSAADAAAYAGAIANRAGATLEDVVATARLVASENGFDLNRGS